MSDCPRWKQFLEETIGDSEIIEELRLFMRAHLSGERFGKAIVLVGHGACGKSVLGNILMDLIGERYVVAMETKDLGREFYRARLFREAGVPAVMVFICDPDFRDTESMGFFKAILAGDSITASRKHENPFDFTPLVNFIFVCNSLPAQASHTSYYRRLSVVPMKFSGQRDPGLEDTLMAELEEIGRWVHKGLGSGREGL